MVLWVLTSLQGFANLSCNDYCSESWPRLTMVSLPCAAVITRQSLVFSKKKHLWSKGKGMQHLHRSASQVNGMSLKFSSSFTKAQPNWFWPFWWIFCKRTWSCVLYFHLVRIHPNEKVGYLPDAFPAVLSEVELQAVLGWGYGLGWY